MIFVNIRIHIKKSHKEHGGTKNTKEKRREKGVAVSNLGLINHDKITNKNPLYSPL